MFLACFAAPPYSSAADAARSASTDWRDAVLYFVIVDRFADGDRRNNFRIDRRNPGGWHGGDLRGLAANIDEIASLGATAIWITPINRQIDFCPPASGPPAVGEFEHCGFHGYWADDYRALDPRFGSEADLKALVDAAHAKGVKVLLDVVYNHTGYDSRYLKERPDWIRRSQVSCDTDPLTCPVGGLPDFKTELPEVRAHLLDAHLGLAKRTGLDGFRLDTVKHIDHEFWRMHRTASRERVAPHFFLLAEVWGGSAEVLDEYFAHDEVDAGFDFTFRGECRAFVKGQGRTVAYGSYLEKRHRVRSPYHLAHYLSSHDEPLQLHELGGDKDAFKLCVALQMTSLGMPVIFYGEEVARSGGDWPLNRNDMPWGSKKTAPGRGVARDEQMRAWYQQLIAVRRQQPALSRGGYRLLSSEGDLLVFAREDEASANAVVVAVNRGAKSAEAQVAAPALLKQANVQDALSGEAATLENERLRVSVPAKSVRIYTKANATPAR